MREKDYSEKMERLNNLIGLYYNIEESKQNELTEEKIKILLGGDKKCLNMKCICIPRGAVFAVLQLRKSML